MATSSQHSDCPLATGRTSFTPWASPSGKPPMAREVAAGKEVPAFVDAGSQAVTAANVAEHIKTIEHSK